MGPLGIRSILIIPGVLFCALAPSSAQASSFPKIYGLHDHGLDEAVAEERRADYSIDYHNDDRMTAHIGKVPDAAIPKIHATRFSRDELRHFFETRQPKDFVVVTLDASMRTDADEKVLVGRLNRYFFEIGFHRVRIDRASGMAVIILSDGMNPKSGPR